MLDLVKYTIFPITWQSAISIKLADGVPAEVQNIVSKENWAAYACRERDNNVIAAPLIPSRTKTKLSCWLDSPECRRFGTEFGWRRAAGAHGQTATFSIHQRAPQITLFVKNSRLFWHRTTITVTICALLHQCATHMLAAAPDNIFSTSPSSFQRWSPIAGCGGRQNNNNVLCSDANSYFLICKND